MAARGNAVDPGFPSTAGSSVPSSETTNGMPPGPAAPAWRRARRRVGIWAVVLHPVMAAVFESASPPLHPPESQAEGHRAGARGEADEVTRHARRFEREDDRLHFPLDADDPSGGRVVAVPDLQLKAGQFLAWPRRKNNG